MFNDKLKSILNSKVDGDSNEDGKKDKKKIEKLVFFVILLIITIIVINVILNDGKSSDSVQNNASSSKQLANTISENKENDSQSSDIKTELENILKVMQGVGDVKVYINYSESYETVAMYNENTKTSKTEEGDTSGGTRTIEEVDAQKEIVYEENNGEKVPVTQKVISPKVEGAIITAKGARKCKCENKYYSSS